MHLKIIVMFSPVDLLPLSVVMLDTYRCPNVKTDEGFGIKVETCSDLLLKTEFCRRNQVKLSGNTF